MWIVEVKVMPDTEAYTHVFSEFRSSIQLKKYRDWTNISWNRNNKGYETLEEAIEDVRVKGRHKDYYYRLKDTETNETIPCDLFIHED